jgi:tetratricopeptide (TPR) repeat protein
MSTLSTLLPSRASSRRPVLLLIVAILFVVAAVLVRMVQMRTMSQPVQPPAAIELSSNQAIGQLQERLRRNPEDAASYALLGQGLLQQVRETGDVTLYTRAGQAFDQALEIDPKQLDALIGQGILALALHDFEGALAWADQAWAINAFRAQTLGIKVDALVELGRYPEAVETLQQMVDLRPDLSSYTRVSYLRELHGEVDGAIEAMTQAATMGMPGTEQWLWTTVQLGHLYWNSGQLAEAEGVYRQALDFQADYPYALAGLARVQAARGDLQAAIAQYETLAKRLPLPEFVVTLGELYQAAGQPDAARQQYDLVRTMQKLNAASGMNVDLELATFDAIHGDDPDGALAAAQAAYAQRPTIYAADTLAWAYYRTGDLANAQTHSEEALRLGTRDALLYFHAGMIAAAQADVRRAQEHLSTALAINPHFSPLWAPQAEATLQELADSQ